MYMSYLNLHETHFPAHYDSYTIACLKICKSWIEIKSKALPADHQRQAMQFQKNFQEVK